MKVTPANAWAAFLLGREIGSEPVFGLRPGFRRIRSGGEFHPGEITETAPAEEKKSTGAASAPRTGGPHERAIRTIGVHARAAAEPATACPTSRRRRCAPGSKKAASRSGWSASRQAQLPACNDPKLPPPAIASRAWKGIVPPRRRGGGDHRGSMHVVPGGV